MKLEVIENIVKQVVKDLQQEGITMEASTYEYGVFDTMEAAIRASEIAQKELLDHLTIYIGQTFKKYIGGKWFIDLENKKNVYYSMPVLTDETYRGVTYVSPMTFATACISRNKGNYISTILLNRMKNMGIEMK